mmetsp:Transcript_4952/g.20399  ORF Transcript_4952/g.20399 Transcript_4952/m.20399 type:complete len:463 (+) Transcript_4952:34-1422(+)
MTEVPLTTAEISEQVKRRQKPVNQGYSLDAYFAVADSTGVTAKIYRDEGNHQELFRVLMAFCSLVVETMGKHRDRGAAAHKARYAAYLAEVKNCMEEMEAIKPGINAEARAFRERIGTADGAPRVTRPPPVGGAVDGIHSTMNDDDDERRRRPAPASSTPSTMNAVDDLLSASPEELAAASAASFETLALVNPNDQTSGSDHARYRPNAEFATVASNDSAARHSLLGTSLPPPARTQQIPATVHVPSSSVSSERYPTVSSTQTAVPRSTANLSVPPPPPPGPPPIGVPSQSAHLTVAAAASRELAPKRVLSVPTPTFASKDHDRLDNRLAAYGLKEKKVRGDGNCQFRALADQLFGDQERHAECRAAVMNQLRAESEHYAVFVPEDWGAYVSEMARDSAWGDHITLQAAADAYGVGMCVISSYKDNFVIEISPRVRRSERILWISFWAEVHYNSIYTADAVV